MTWTKEEDDLLRKLWPTVVPDKMMGDVFGRRAASVHDHAFRIGLKSRYVARRAAAIELLREIENAC